MEIGRIYLAPALHANLFEQHKGHIITVFLCRTCRITGKKLTHRAN